jgi:hypothetical protein
MVHISLDGSEDMATAWAKQFNQPWPTILREDLDTGQFVSPFFPGGGIPMPSYILVDRKGKEVARGKAAALAAAKKDEA